MPPTDFILICASAVFCSCKINAVFRFAQVLGRPQSESANVNDTGESVLITACCFLLFQRSLIAFLRFRCK